MKSRSGSVGDGEGGGTQRRRDADALTRGAVSNNTASANVSVAVVIARLCQAEHITLIILPEAIIRCGLDPDPAPALRGNQ